MSTFGGKLEEIPEISVDRFDGENVNSLVYFLSHCHTDHMHGLDDWAFHKFLLDRPDVFLYASPISVRILKGKHPNIETKLKELPIGDATLIKVPYALNTNISVTLLPAGHCPGSVMFLFETADKTILYTGDYRVSMSDLKKYRAFYSLGRLKSFDKVYLDTTFFKTSFLRLPPRQDSLESICQFIKDWISLSKGHIIQISLSARYGSEFLFLELAKVFGMPVHVGPEVYNTYKYIPEMDKAITLKRGETQIHAGCDGLKNICMRRDYDASLIRNVIPSALWWENDNFTKGIATVTEKGDLRVCYSCHASYEEIKDFLLFLKPKAIEPCVVPSNCREKEIMLKLLEGVVKSYDSSSKEDLESNEIKFFMTDLASSSQMGSPAKLDEIPEDILGSPKKCFKRKRLN